MGGLGPGCGGGPFHEIVNVPERCLGVGHKGVTRLLKFVCIIEGTLCSDGISDGISGGISQGSVLEPYHNLSQRAARDSFVSGPDSTSTERICAQHVSVGDALYANCRTYI